MLFLSKNYMTLHLKKHQTLKFNKDPGYLELSRFGKFPGSALSLPQMFITVSIHSFYKNELYTPNFLKRRFQQHKMQKHSPFYLEPKCVSKLVCTCDYRGRTLLYMIIFNSPLFLYMSHNVSICS